jgi:Family of unknown function (DUF6454)
VHRRSALALLFVSSIGQPLDGQLGTVVADRVAQLTRTTKWTRVAAVAIGFNTFHPQGMVKIGGALFVSSVEVHDRGGGKGVGHLFKINAADGSLIADRTLGEGAIYHPGGIDYDGTDIWVPVAEYRPDSRSIVYRVNPESMVVSEVLRANDHLGAIVHDVDDGSLYGVSWGSRRFLQWTHRQRGWVAARTIVNPSHYLDYQDCKYAGRHRAICGGVTELRQAQDAVPFRLGGIDLIDLTTGRPLHQSPMLLWTANGLDMTHNPLWVEATGGGLRAYFMPEDERSTLYVFEAVP